MLTLLNVILSVEEMEVHAGSTRVEGLEEGTETAAAIAAEAIDAKLVAGWV